MELGALRLEKVKIWNLVRIRQLRYVVIEAESGYYLVDLDDMRQWGGYLLPLFNWLIPQRLMKVSLPAEKVNELLLNKELEEKNRRNDASISYGAVGVLGTTLLSPLLDPIVESWESNLSVYMGYFLLFIPLLSLLFLKMSASKKSKRVPDLIGEEHLIEVKARFYPVSIRQGIKILGLFVFVILLGFTGFGLFIVESLWLGYIIGLLMLLIFLFINSLIVAVQSEYKIKLVSEESCTK